MTRVYGWRLFAALAFAISAADCFILAITDLRSRGGAEFIVIFSVLCALPCLLVAFTASSLAVLWPGCATRWLLSNRRYIGVAFAYGMTWHFSLVSYFIFRFGNPVKPFDLTLDLIGLTTLLAMTLTSFRAVSRHLSLRNWRRLHKTGIYVLWLVPTYFYFDDVKRDRDPFDLAVLSVMLSAGLFRFAAWRRQTALVKQAA